MAAKRRIKMALDALMTLGLLFKMGYQLYAETAHEWVGAGMFALFIAHHALNFRWYKAALRGRYTPYRVFQLAVNVLLLAAMLFLMASGIMLSNHVFDFLGIGFGASFARLAHLAASHWGFVLMALHLGMHWGAITARLKLRNPRLWNALGALVACYGLYVFIERNLLDYMFLRVEFAFLDFSEPIARFYLDCLAMTGLFIFASHHASELLRKRGSASRHT